MQIQRITMPKLFGARKLAPHLAELARISLFGQLTPGELELVGGLLHPRDYLADEVVFDAGEQGQAIYFVHAGDVALLRVEPGVAQARQFAVLGPGSFFGDLALIDDVPRSAQARALTPCRLTVFFRDDFLGLMETHARIASKIALQLAREMGRRLREQAEGSHAWRQHL